MRQFGRRVFLGGLAASAFGLGGCDATSRDAESPLGHPPLRSITHTSTVPSSNYPPAVAAIGSLKLVNWYPYNAGWSRLWTAATEPEILSDFTAIAEMGANAVRVIVSTYAFGFPTPEPAMMNKLSLIVTLATRTNIQVQLTLFDFFGNYSEVAASQAWMRTVLDPFKDDPRICFVELKNEINPTDAMAMDWVSKLCPITKEVVGATPLTLSVTSAVGAPALESWVRVMNRSGDIDFFDFHWYGEEGQAAANLASMKALAGESLLFIGETGASSYPVGLQTMSQAEAAQAAYLNAVIDACRSLKLPLPAPWVWRDFTVAALPDVGNRISQLYYGLLRLDGSHKPSYGVVHRAYA